MVACPYAKKIRGTVAYCSLINKKVSTLRYPCKGNYRRCPIYIRYRARAAPVAQPQPEQAPPPPPPAREQAPLPPRPSAEQAPQPSPQPSPPPPRPSGALVRPSESLCDSLILAALITTARALDRYSGDLRSLVEELISRTRGSDILLFFIGQSDGRNVRMLAHAGRVVYAFEAGGSPVCGGDAQRMYEELLPRRVDGIIYEVKWEDIPLWRETVKSEFG